MNPITQPAQARNSFAPGRKGPLLPQYALVTVPPRLYWVLKRQLSNVVIRCRMNLTQTDLTLDNLSALERAFGQQECMDVCYSIRLYGYELRILYAFLLEQERSYVTWGPHVIPMPIYWSVRASLRGFIDQLRTLCRRTDLYAARPIQPQR